MVFGQSFGASAIINQSSRTEVTPSFTHNGVPDFGVDIWWVGYSGLASSEISMDADGTYHFITDDPTSLNLVVLKTNISGYTCWGNCSDTSLDMSEGELTVGQLFLIVDGLVSQVGSAYISSAGQSVGLIGYGTHVITLLYTGKDQAGGFQWGSDTIIIRVGSAEDKLGDYATVTAPFSHTLTDTAVANETIEANALPWEPIWSSYIKFDNYTVYNEVDVGLSGTADTDGTYYGFDSSVSVSGMYNSTGFEGYQIDGIWNTTVGNAFVVDGTGVRYLDSSVTSVTLTDTVLTSYPEARQSTFVGVLVLADYGRYWAGNMPSWQAFADIEGLNYVYNTTNVDETSARWAGGGRIEMDASFDFLEAMDGTTLTISSQAKDVEITNTGTTTTTQTTTDTSTVVTTSTQPDETITSTITTESPGFGIIVSLLTIGVIAFAAPRLRREN
jgi:hypothetical protein